MNYKVAVYKCSVCQRTTQIVVKISSQNPLSCNITKNCNGHLGFVCYQTTKTSNVSAKTDIEQENFSQRGYSATDTANQTDEALSILSGKGVINVAISKEMLVSSLISNGTIDFVKFKSALVEQQGELEEHDHISESQVFTNDNYADYIVLNLISKNKSLSNRLVCSFTKNSGTLVIAGADDSGTKLEILNTDTVSVTVNGTLLDSTAFSISGDEIILVDAIYYDMSTVIITCQEYKIVSEFSLELKRTNNIQLVDIDQSYDEFSKLSSLYKSSWNNVLSIIQGVDELLVFFTDDIDINEISFNEYLLNSVEFKTVFRYNKPVKNKYGAWKTYDAYYDTITVSETIDPSGYVLIGETPYGFSNKNTTDAIKLSSLSSNKILIDYRDGIDILAPSSIVENIFPVFNIDNTHASASLKILSTTSSDSASTYIIGPS